MVWQLPDGSHEGRVAYRFSDWAFGTRWSQNAVVISHLGDSAVVDGGEMGVRDGSDVVGWTVVCGCGWRSKPWWRKEAPDEVNAWLRQISVPAIRDGDDLVVDALFQDWSSHTLPIEALQILAATAAEERRMAELHSALTQRLLQEGKAARAAGASWTDIGAAAGFTRQAAQQRWGGRSRDRLKAES